MKLANIDIPHPDKPLYPDDNITKKAVAEYFSKIFKYILPFLKERPVTMKRFTDGINEPGFYNKHRPDYFPDFIDSLTVPTKKEQSNMCMAGIHSEQALVYLAGQDVIEIHIGLSTMSAIEKPDQIIFDFDPCDDDFEKIRKATQSLKNILDNLNITSLVKTSGSRGLHVHIPLEPKYTFNTVKTFAKKIAEKLNQLCPDITTLETRKNKRGNKVFIDFLRNDYAMTAIAPYSLRAIKGAPVATPLHWSEVNNSSLQPQSYNINNIFRRLSQIDDPWESFNRYNRHNNIETLLNDEW